MNETKNVVESLHVETQSASRPATTEPGELPQRLVPSREQFVPEANLTTAIFKDVKASFTVSGIPVQVEAREVSVSFERRSAPEPQDTGSSRPLTRHELGQLLAAPNYDGRAVLEDMLPKGANVPAVVAEISGGKRIDALEGVFPFVGKPEVDPTQLEQFCREFGNELGPALSVSEVSNTKFQTQEDWNGYVSTGALRFISGGKVTRPLSTFMENPAKEMTYGLRAGQDPSVSPLKVGIFSDFGNGLYASRQIARRIVEQKFPYAFHLGDVYYNGDGTEFRDYFEEPLAPLLDETELFMVAGNHEMYSEGAYFQGYLTRKLGHPKKLQRQRAEHFRLVAPGMQVIGLDNMWCNWEGGHYRGNSPKLDARTLSLVETWLAENQGGLNILMTTDEPFSIEASGTTHMLEDLRPFVQRGLVDIWFWGNVHHAALYDPFQFDGSGAAGFIGACVGHGGYPFYTQKKATPASGVKCRWFESKHRFWPMDRVRPDVGLNGWCEMALAKSDTGWNVTLIFKDWVGRNRLRVGIRKNSGGPAQILRVEENQSASRTGDSWTTVP